jgi:hypothetical protein
MIHHGKTDVMSQLQYNRVLFSYKMTQGSEKDYKAANSGISKRSAAVTPHVTET